MKLNKDTQNIDVLTSFGVDEEESMMSQIDMSNLPLIFQMFSKHLYQDPIGSIVREITSNGIDAHIHAGKEEEPIIIRFDYDDEEDTYFIEFKDYGKGLTLQQMTEIYLVWFKSTRRESNNFLGMFGIGSKSPFAYRSDYYKIMSSTDGIRRHYLYRMMETEDPKLDLLYEEDEEEEYNGSLRTGVTIRIDLLQEGDITLFCRKIKQQLKYFPSVYVDISAVEHLVNYADKPVNNYSIYDADLYKFRTDLQGEDRILTASLGNVVYPINFDMLDMTPIHINAAIKLNVGDVEVVPSREAIKYTEFSIDALKKAIQEFKDHIRDEMESLILNLNPIRYDFRSIYENIGVIESLQLDNGLVVGYQIYRDLESPDDDSIVPDAIDLLGQNFFKDLGVKKLKGDPLFFLKGYNLDDFNETSAQGSKLLRENRNFILIRDRKSLNNFRWLYPNLNKLRYGNADKVIEKSYKVTPNTEWRIRYYMYQLHSLYYGDFDEFVKTPPDLKDIHFSNTRVIYLKRPQSYMDKVKNHFVGKEDKILTENRSTPIIEFYEDSSTSLSAKLYNYINTCLEYAKEYFDISDMEFVDDASTKYREYEKAKKLSIKMAKQKGNNITTVEHLPGGERRSNKTTIEKMLELKELVIHGNLNDQSLLDLTNNELVSSVLPNFYTVYRVSEQNSKLIKQNVKCSIHVRDLFYTMNSVTIKIATAIYLIENQRTIDLAILIRRIAVRSLKDKYLEILNPEINARAKHVAEFVTSLNSDGVKDLIVKVERLRDLNPHIYETIKELAEETDFYDYDVIDSVNYLEGIIRKAPLLPLLLDNVLNTSLTYIADYLRMCKVKLSLKFYQNVQTRIRMAAREYERANKYIALPEVGNTSRRGMYLENFQLSRKVVIQGRFTVGADSYKKKGNSLILKKSSKSDNCYFTFVEPLLLPQTTQNNDNEKADNPIWESQQHIRLTGGYAGII